MVSSSKKKRGKERKAAAVKNSADSSTANDNRTTAAAAAAAAGGNSLQSIPVLRVPAHLARQQLSTKKKIVPSVAHIRKGRNFTTELAISTDISLEDSGILSVVLNFLKRCEEETFDGIIDSVGGNLKTPTTWIKIIISAVINEDSCRIQIANSIGPLVRCMCNDTTRLFFKSNKHWTEAISIFAGLIAVMIDVTNDLDTLFQHDGLLSTIVQWGFWESHRPDIAMEMKAEEISSLGREITEKLVIMAADNEQTEDGKNLLETIGTTPIISKHYDSSCMVSYVTGLMRHIRVDGFKKEQQRAISILQHLIVDAECVDKGVIGEVVSFEITDPSDDWLPVIARISYHMLLIKGHPSDTRVSFAIRAGLIELCLSFIQRHARRSVPLLFKYINNILAVVNRVSFHQKTAKAIRSKKTNIEELLRSEKNTEITNNVHCKKLIDMLRYILDLNASYCCRCNKPLDRMDVKECNGCHRLIYCSRACQREDWSNGHKLTCCKTYTIDLVGQFQGRILPVVPSNGREAAKLEELEMNITKIQLKLFLDNSETILNQASSLGIHLFDCIVYFDLREYPATVTIKNYNEDFRPGMKKIFEYGRSKENITCIYRSYIYISSVTGDLIMQRLFPHEWMTAKNAKLEQEKERRILMEKRHMREQYEEKKKVWEEKMKKAKATYVKETIERLKKDGEESDSFREILAEFLDKYGEEWEEPSDFHRKLDEFLKSKNKELKQDDTEKRNKEAAEILGKSQTAACKSCLCLYNMILKLTHFMFDLH